MGDLAADGLGLLDHLGIARAHLCGMSMGGFIVQTMALLEPARILSLTSISSGTGNPELPVLDPAMATVIMTPYPAEREAAMAHQLEIYRAISGAGFPFEEQWHRRFIAKSFARGVSPKGKMRQFAAVVAQDNRKPALGTLTAPTLVVHGAADRLVLPAGGRDTAAAIPGAKLVLIEGMGHDLPTGRGPWPQVIAALRTHLRENA